MRGCWIVPPICTPLSMYLLNIQNLALHICLVPLQNNTCSRVGYCCRENDFSISTRWKCFCFILLWRFCFVWQRCGQQADYDRLREPHRQKKTKTLQQNEAETFSTRQNSKIVFHKCQNSYWDLIKYPKRLPICSHVHPPEKQNTSYLIRGTTEQPRIVNNQLFK